MFSTCFRVKNVKEFKHNHDIIYQGRSSENGCNDHCVGENSRWTLERVLNHAERDSNQHLFTNSVENGYPVLEKKKNAKLLEKSTKTRLENKKSLKYF